MAQLYLLAGATTVANAIKPIGEITALYILSLFPLSMHRASREVLHKLIHAMYRGCVYIYICMDVGQTMTVYLGFDRY